MAREHLSNRENWQGKSVARGHGAEDVFSTIMHMHLENTDFETEHKPTDLAGIYGFRGTNNNTPHGIWPEFMIRNKTTGKAIFVEIKRQKAGGNAHERACKYFMPGIIESARNIAKHPPGIIPFWLIFTNGIAKDRWYRQEIEHWFRGYEQHLLLWKNVLDRQAVIKHFETHIRPMLEK